MREGHVSRITYIYCYIYGRHGHEDKRALYLKFGCFLWEPFNVNTIMLRKTTWPNGAADDMCANADCMRRLLHDVMMHSRWMRRAEHRTRRMRHAFECRPLK